VAHRFEAQNQRRDELEDGDFETQLE
jgi:hypothetical protein